MAWNNIRQLARLLLRWGLWNPELLAFQITGNIVMWKLSNLFIVYYSIFYHLLFSLGTIVCYSNSYLLFFYLLLF